MQSAAPSPVSKRILFVDDEPGIRATLPSILTRYGFTVDVAATVTEALERILEHTFDALICDLNISKDGDGYNVVRAVKAKNPRCVTVILTGYPGVESAVEGIHYGIDDYIAKPSDLDTLVASLAKSSRDSSLEVAFFASRMTRRCYELGTCC